MVGAVLSSIAIALLLVYVLWQRYRRQAKLRNSDQVLEKGGKGAALADLLPKLKPPTAFPLYYPGRRSTRRTRHDRRGNVGGSEGEGWMWNTLAYGHPQISPSIPESDLTETPTPIPSPNPTPILRTPPPRLSSRPSISKVADTFIRVVSFRRRRQGSRGLPRSTGTEPEPDPEGLRSQVVAMSAEIQRLRSFGHQRGGSNTSTLAELLPVYTK